jgi:predicted nucleotidyltransferase
VYHWFMAPLSPEAEFQIRKAERLLKAREERRALLRELALRAAQVLRSEFGATEVWLFGSVRRAWFHEGSDLDLAAAGLKADDVGCAWDRLSEVLGEDVDLVSLDEADEGLRRRIYETGERVDDAP